MPIRMPKVEFDVVELKGGMDQITPTLALKPGVCRDAVNFECAVTGGYTRVGGYERYSGLAKPSDATYQVIQVVTFVNTPTVGQTLTGATSGATGYIAAVVEASKYMVLTQIVGTYTPGEVVKVGVTTIGTSTDLTATITSKEYAQYQNLAADVYRALIAAVPGSGAVRGVVGLIVAGVDKVYAFRDNAGGTSCDLYVASSSGWTQISYKFEISFTAGGTAIPADGATLTQGGVTAIVRRVMASSGSQTWAAADTAGRFVIDTPAGGNFAAGAATLTGGATCTLSGAQTAIAMLPGGKFEFYLGNLSGSSSTLRLHGCDGVNRGFEFDGTTLAPVPTVAAIDTPSYVVVFKNHLMWGLASSLIFSGPGLPYRYLAVTGGGEIPTGDIVTGFLIQRGTQAVGALTVYGRGATNILYGTGLSDWNFVQFDPNVGAIGHTAQNLAQSYVLDDRGVTGLATTQAYGNFESATLTNNIKTFIISQRSKVAYSLISRDKSQYRVFFNDGYALYLTIVNGKLLGSMPQLFPNIVNCAWSGELTGGSEVSYVGDTSGFVHQLDVGSSFDGADIDAYIKLNWNSMRSPRLLKRMRHASVEMQGSFYAEISFGYQLGYGTAELAQPSAATHASGFIGASNWDDFTWDNFTWDGRTLFPTEVDLQGTAENIQVTITSGGDYIYPFTVNSVISHFTVRRGLR